MESIWDEIRQYFDNTSKEQIKSDWEKSKESDEIGITVESFLANTETENMLQELVALLKDKDPNDEYLLRVIAQYIVDNFNRKQEPYTPQQEGKV